MKWWDSARKLASSIVLIQGSLAHVCSIHGKLKKNRQWWPFKPQCNWWQWSQVENRQFINNTTIYMWPRTPGHFTPSPQITLQLKKLGWNTTCCSLSLATSSTEVFISASTKWLTHHPPLRFLAWFKIPELIGSLKGVRAFYRKWGLGGVLLQEV